MCADLVPRDSFTVSADPASQADRRDGRSLFKKGDEICSPGACGSVEEFPREFSGEGKCPAILSDALTKGRSGNRCRSCEQHCAPYLLDELSPSHIHASRQILTVCLHVLPGKKPFHRDLPSFTDVSVFGDCPNVAERAIKNDPHAFAKADRE